MAAAAARFFLMMEQGGKENPSAWILKVGFVDKFEVSVQTINFITNPTIINLESAFS